jgi:hypothetical protein
MTRRLALAWLLLLPLLVAAAVALPGRIDWDGYRGVLAENASERLGRPIGLNGGLRLRLLPQTLIEADGLTIGSSNDGVALTARAMRLRLDPWLLLLGRVVVREVVLVGADIRLPWPPTRLPGLATLGLDGLTLLDARLEESRISVAGASIEGVSASFIAGGLADALRAEGRFNWRGQPLSFNATLGRAGDDGAAPLDIAGQIAGSRIAARGALLAEGGFEGRLDAVGQDLSALLPTPRGAFTATGRLTATADVVGVDQLVLDMSGQQARGGISLRLAAEPRPDAPRGAAPGARLDAALLASRLDLDAWTEALRRGGSPELPIGLDLSAEAASFRGVALRRLRLTVHLENGRIIVPEASAELPGEGTINASGAGTANASEWALRFDTRRAPDTLAAFGGLNLPAGVAPLAHASGSMRLVLDERQAAFSDMALNLDGSRVAGTATWRWGERPVLGLGLEFARLDLDPWLAAGESLSRMDVNLRITAERARLHDVALEALSIDASAEGGRLVLRRALARHGGADITAAGNGTLAPPRVNEAVLEAQGGTLGGTLALMPQSAWLNLPEPMAALPLRLRAQLAGPPEALSVRAEASVDDARLEAQLALDIGQRRAGGTFTLRHPGAARLLGPLMGPAGRQWLGEGSLAIIASLAMRPGLLAAESLDVVAGQVRLRGPLSLNREGTRPRLTGHLTTESLALPELPIATLFAALRGFDMELALRAENLLPPPGLLPTLSGLRGLLRLEEGRLAIAVEEARLSGGTLQGVLRADTTANPPALALEARLEGAVVTEALLGGSPPDVTSGRADAVLALSAAGHGPDAWRATLAGRGDITIRDGTLLGVDLAALAAALALSEAEAEVARPAVAAALSGGSTPFTSLTLPFTAEAGLLRLGGAVLEGEAGMARLSGQYDLARARLDMRLAMPQPQGPDVGLWFGGGADSRRSLPEMSAYWRWRNTRE